jgi:hypothetical protein
MKYLRKFNEMSETEMKDFFKDIIDLDIIDDAKQIALEYIDIGYYLAYSVAYNQEYYGSYLKQPKRYTRLVILYGSFSHERNKMHYDYNDGITIKDANQYFGDLDENKIEYIFSLIHTSSNIPVMSEHTNKIIDKLKVLYDAKIISGDDLDKRINL